MQTQQQPPQLRHQKYFQFIQSNSQYLTMIRKSLLPDTGKSLPFSKTYIQNNNQIRIDYQNFIQCLIQITYLIYTCQYYGFNPIIDLQDVRIVQNCYNGYQMRFSIVIYYRFSQLPRQNSTYSPIIRDIYKYLLDLYILHQKNLKPLPFDNQYRISIQTFIQQLTIIDTKLIDPLQNHRQKLFYLYLQQTDLFKQYSMLLKIKNNTILNFIKIQFNKFKIYKQKDINIINQYNNQKKKLKSDYQQLKKKQNLIQKNIIQFFQQITKYNPKFKFKIQIDQFFKNKFIFIVYDTPSQPFLTRISKINHSQDQFMYSQTQFPKQKNSYSQYQIQYNSQRNSICVRLILSTIAYTTQSIDYVMFQSNILTFESANISLQFVQQKSQKNQTTIRKNLAFRGSSCFNVKQPMLQKILILMDQTLIAAKVYQPQLISMRRRFMPDKDSYKLQSIHQKVNHYTKIFLRCSKKIYSQ